MLVFLVCVFVSLQTVRSLLRSEVVHTFSSESPGTSVATVRPYANCERVHVGCTRSWVGSQKDGPIF